MSTEVEFDFDPIDQYRRVLMSEIDDMKARIAAFEGAVLPLNPYMIRFLGWLKEHVVYREHEIVEFDKLVGRQ